MKTRKDEKQNIISWLPFFACPVKCSAYLTGMFPGLKYKMKKIDIIGEYYKISIGKGGLPIPFLVMEIQLLTGLRSYMR